MTREQPFTPEQETRITEIVADVLLGMHRRRATMQEVDIKDQLVWACEYMGLPNPCPEPWERDNA